MSKSGIGTDLGQTEPPKLAGGVAGVQVQLVQLIQMKTPLSAVKQSAQLSGYKGDIITLYRSYQ